MTTTSRPKAVTVKIEPPVSLTRDRDRALAQATITAITTAEEYVVAVDALKRLKAAEKTYAAGFLDMRRPIREALDTNLAREKEWLAPLRETIAKIETVVQTWRDEQRAREEALRAKAREEAEAKAREERAQQVAALEQAAKATSSRIEKRALRDQASQLASASVVAVAERIESTVPKVTGVYDRETWYAEVINLKALVIAVAVPLLLERVAAASLTRTDAPAEDVAFAERLSGWLLREAGGQAQIDYLLPNQERLDAIAVQCRDEVPVPGVVGRRKTTTVYSSRGEAR